MVLPFEVTVCNCNVIPSELSALYVSLVRTVLLIVPCLFKKAQTQKCSFQPDTWRSNPNQHHRKIKQSCLFLFFFSFSFFANPYSVWSAVTSPVGGTSWILIFFSGCDGQLRIFRSNKCLLSANNVRRNIVDIAALVAPDNLVMVVMMMKRTMMMKQKWSVTPPSLPPDRPHPCHMYDYKWRFPLHVYQE